MKNIIINKIRKTNPYKCKNKFFLYNLFDNNKNRVQCKNPLVKTSQLIKEGKIIALKNIGGFHLVCDAHNEKVIKELRKRKNRKHKPFALMAKDIKTIRKYCILDEDEEQLLLNNKRSIVLLKKNYNELPLEIAPNLNKIGIMLPYTLEQYIIFNEGINLIIMTSGNVSGSYTEFNNNEAFCKLKYIADYFLINQKKLNTYIDDSLIYKINDFYKITRRGRGYAPFLFKSNYRVKDSLIASGSEINNNFCMYNNDNIYFSERIGNIGCLEVFNNYKNRINKIKEKMHIKKCTYICDMHPSYINNIYIKKNTDNVFKVQHHHAHMVSCMTENNIHNKVIGVIFDGVGYGLDKKIWGGEFLIGDRKDFNRLGHFEYVNIQGGDSAEKYIWKAALSYIYNVDNNYVRKKGIKILNKYIKKEDITIILNALQNNLNCFECCSVGRLFDAISSILGIKQRVSYDAQGAIELENLINNMNYNNMYTFKNSINKLKNEYIINYKELFYGIIEDIEKGTNIEEISIKFHNWVINVTFEIINLLKLEYNIKEVVLSGGVFDNKILLEGLYKKLKNNSFEVYYNKQIPSNDGGIAIGQIIIALENLKGK